VKTAVEGARGGCERCPIEKGAVARNGLLKGCLRSLFSFSLCSPLPSPPLSLSLSLSLNITTSQVQFLSSIVPRAMLGTHVESRDRLRWDSLYTPERESRSEKVSVTDDRFTLILLALAKGTDHLDKGSFQDHCIQHTPPAIAHFGRNIAVLFSRNALLETSDIRFSALRSASCASFTFSFTFATTG